MAKEAAKKFVTETIAKNPVVVFSKTYCPYCTKAKNAFASVGFKNFLAVELDEREDGGDIQAALGEITGATSVPRVFVAQQFIGGGDDTARKASNGELAALLKANSLL